jgi:hypothetical protein
MDTIDCIVATAAESINTCTIIASLHQTHLMNLLCEDDGRCWSRWNPTRTSILLRSGVYVLVVTTHEYHTMGPFSVDVSGPRGFIIERFNQAWNSSKSSVLKQGT